MSHRGSAENGGHNYVLIQNLWGVSEWIEDKLELFPSPHCGLDQDSGTALTFYFCQLWVPPLQQPIYTMDTEDIKLQL